MAAVSLAQNNDRILWEQKWVYTDEEDEDIDWFRLVDISVCTGVLPSLTRKDTYLEHNKKQQIIHTKLQVTN